MTVRGSAAEPRMAAGPGSGLRWRGVVPGWPEDVPRLGPAGSCGPPSLMLPLFVRQRETPVVRQSEITPSWGIGWRRRYLVGDGRGIRPGKGPATPGPVRDMP